MPHLQFDSHKPQLLETHEPSSPPRVETQVLTQIPNNDKEIFGAAISSQVQLGGLSDAISGVFYAPIDGVTLPLRRCLLCESHVLPNLSLMMRLMCSC